jgi:hypothetical protein
MDIKMKEEKKMKSNIEIKKSINEVLAILNEHNVEVTVNYRVYNTRRAC